MGIPKNPDIHMHEAKPGNRSIDCRGHAVGASCVFALAHDYRLMSSERGYIFMNEVNAYIDLSEITRFLEYSTCISRPPSFHIPIRLTGMSNFLHQVDLGMSLVPGVTALLRAKLPVSTSQEAILTVSNSKPI